MDMYYRFTENGVDFYFDLERQANGSWTIKKFSIENDGIRKDEQRIRIVTFENDLELNTLSSFIINNSIQELIARYDAMLDLLSDDGAIKHLSKIYKNDKNYCILCEGFKESRTNSISFHNAEESVILTDALNGEGLEDFDAIVLDDKEKVNKFFKKYDSFMKEFNGNVKPLLSK